MYHIRMQLDFITSFSFIILYVSYIMLLVFSIFSCYPYIDNSGVEKYALGL